MEDQELRQRFEAMDVKMAEVQKTTRKLYRVFLATVIISVALFVLPLIGLFFAIPSFINTYSNISGIQ